MVDSKDPKKSSPLHRTSHPTGATQVPSDPTVRSSSDGLRVGPTRVPAEVTAAPKTAWFGKFVCVVKLGAGGMGEVWKAWDMELSRWVALKFLKAEDNEIIARFQREAQLAAGLSHPNIAAVYETGEAQGRHFIAMQFVEGQTLKTVPRRDRKKLVLMIRDAAEGVASANQQGVIHRDLKPENIMVSSGDRPRIYVMDFGLARSVEGGSDMSVSGSVVGTPSYMPPEQARGERVDERADVYSMGGTLYQLLTDRSPFKGANVLDTLRKVLEEEPKPLRKIDPKIDADLETIVLKCLEKDPERRYANMEALVGDLNRWLEGEAISAHPPSFLYRFRKKVAKRKALVAVGLLGIGAAVAAVAILLPKLTSTQGDLELWSKISALISQGENFDRAGETARAREKLDEGIRICEAFLQSRETAAAFYFVGRLRRARGDAKGAMQAFDQALKLDPDMGEAHYERGLLRLREYQRAVSDLRFKDTSDVFVEDEGFESRHPEVIPIRKGVIADLSAPKGRSSYFDPVDEIFGKAQVVWLQGRREEARVGFLKTVDLNPVHLEALVALAQIDMSMRNFQSGLTWASKAVSLNPRSIPALYCRGKARDELKDFAGALADFNEIIRLDPADEKALNDRALSKMQAGDFKGAIEDFDQSIRRDPKFMYSYMNRGMSRLEAGDIKGALEDLDVSVRMIPTNAGAWHNRGLVREAAGDRKGAFEDFLEATRVGPRLPLAWERVVQYRAAQGDMAGAFKAIEEALKYSPTCGQLISIRGYLRVQTHDLDGALEDFNKALQIKPDDDESLFNRAVVLADKGDRDAAFEDYNVLLQINPRFTNAWVNRALLRRLRKDLKGTEEDLDQALRLAPKHYIALCNRASTRFERNNPNGAIEDWTTAIGVNPSDPDGWYYRGRVRITTGDSDAGAKDLDRALQVAPPDWSLRAQAEALLLRLKNP